MSQFLPSWMQALGQTAQAMPQGQGMLRPLRTLEQLRGDYYAAGSDLDLADSLMNTEYIPHSGALGALAMMFNAYQGRKTKEDANKRISDILREQGEVMSRAEREELDRKRSEAEAEFQRKVKAAEAAGYSPQQALAVAEGVPLPKARDPREAILAKMSPEELEQSARVKYGLAPRPGSGTSVTVKGPENDLMAAVSAGYISPEEAQRVVRTKMGLELPIDKQMAADQDAAKQGQRADAALNQAGDVLQTVREAKDLAGPLTAGMGSVLSRVPGTDAKDLQAKLTTIKANLGFDKLQQMREMSPTGGALGQVAVQELESLQATVASLDQAQSPAELQAALDKINRHYSRWQNAVMRSRPQGSRPGEIIPNSQAPSNDDELLMRYSGG